ncbi:MAG: endonuclease Q family protein [Candidatus Bathyarchaeota archaeon]
MVQREIADNISKLKLSSNNHLIFADFHIHSLYSRATSEKMDIESIAHFVRLKGLNLVGTGDFTHPGWIKNLKSSLSEIHNTGIYQLKTETNISTYFIVTGEICTIFNVAGKTKKIHHLITVPNLETAEQINDKLSIHGNLSSDGRPILTVSASELVEEIMEVSRDSAVIPAHVWTPWYSLFGSINGFNRIEDCYEDTTKYIFALETGLSSDPPMNWRLSALDRFALISNSDSHSPYPYRLGREANIFEVKELSYKKIYEAIRTKDPKSFRCTIETNPAYGKYHWTGHRNCGVSLPPHESKLLGGNCPVCHKLMTKGVEERVENLADRPHGFKPQRAIGYLHLLPLHEAIAVALQVNNLSSPSVWRIFNTLISAFSNEYSILLNVPYESLQKVVEPRIAEVILRFRNNEIAVIPGYDGVYGQIKIFGEEKTRKSPDKQEYEKQSNLGQFM